MDRLRQQIEEWITLVLLEAIEWIVFAREMRRRVEIAMDALEARTLDLSATLYARHHAEVN